VSLGWLATVAGALALYVAAPNQALLAGQVLHRRGWRVAGVLLLAVALAMLLTALGSATAVFTWATGAMLVWSVVPIVARWWRFRGEAR
jgi:hypothetical protein